MFFVHSIKCATSFEPYLINLLSACFRLTWYWLAWDNSRAELRNGAPLWVQVSIVISYSHLKLGEANVLALKSQNSQKKWILLSSIIITINFRSLHYPRQPRSRAAVAVHLSDPSSLPQRRCASLHQTGGKVHTCENYRSIIWSPIVRVLWALDK